MDFNLKIIFNCFSAYSILLLFQEVSSPHANGEHVSLSNPSEIRENGSTNGSDKIKVERPPSRSGSSSSRSTPSLKSKDVSWDY